MLDQRRENPRGNARGLGARDAALEDPHRMAQLRQATRDGAAHDAGSDDDDVLARRDHGKTSAWCVAASIPHAALLFLPPE